MASESVTILIDADDQASRKLAQVAKAVDDNVKGIRTVGERAKKSTEFVGTLANAMGATPFGQYAQGLAQITERVSNLSEVMKAGTWGAFAFKAGLIGMAGVIGLQVGKALGGVIFQTERWNKELAKATEESKRLNAEIAKGEERRFQRRVEDTQIAGDPKAIAQEQKKLLSEIEQEMRNYEERIKSNTKAIQERDAQWLKITSFGSKEARAQERREELAADREKLSIMQERARALQYELREEKAARDAKKLAFEEEKKQLEEVQRQKEQYAQEFSNFLDRLQEDRDKEINDERKNQEREELRKAKEKEDFLAANDRTASNRPAQAFEGRLLTRGGPGNDPVAKNTKEALDELKNVNKALNELNRYNRTGNHLNLQVVQ